MGSADGYDNEKPVHSVRISQPFYFGVTPVTQVQWESVMGDNPSEFKGDANSPVESVSWSDVQRFLAKLEEQDSGVRYRLPTEAEWEYAARAGTTTAYSFGDDASQLGEHAWYDENSGDKMYPVGQLKANGWGLHDMHGNVWEWVQDWYGDYTAATADAPAGPVSRANRVIRGGSWRNLARNCRSSNRRHGTPGNRYSTVGCRVLWLV
jgi:formylglycine-generating enzyme required for sulfatase activity